MTVEPYRGEHLRALLLQPAQAFLAAALGNDLAAEKIRQASDAYTAFAGGRVLGCGGVIELDKGRGLAWALLGSDIGAHMTAITRATKRILDACALRRVEANVEQSFRAGHRWAQLLGFTDETPNGMRQFRPGETFHLYARVKNG